MDFLANFVYIHAKSSNAQMLHKSAQIYDIVLQKIQWREEMFSDINVFAFSRRSGEHGRWSTRRCFRTFENQSHIKCACYHFTNFAVLFKITDDQV